MSFLRKLKSVFSPSKLNIVRGVVGSVYPIVELVAQMTPTKTDDEIMACANALGVKTFLIARPEDQGEALKEIAISVAKKKLKSVPVDVIARSVEAAYQQMKAKDSL